MKYIPPLVPPAATACTDEDHAIASFRAMGWLDVGTDNPGELV